MSEVVVKAPVRKGRWRVWRRRLGRCAAAGVVMVLAVWGAGEVALRVVPFENKSGMGRGSTIVEDRDGVELAAFVGADEAWCMPVRSEEISPYLKLAIVAVEDRRFASHHGVDWVSAAGAAWQDVRALRAARGASTLSMQVVRLREHQDHGWLGKMVQAFRAEQLELHAGKDEILTEYLNRAPFGGNLVGAGAASWRYFGKACRDLSLGQAALLAGLPQSPSRFRPDKSPELARVRRAHVLEQMRACGVITEADVARGNAEPIDAQWRALPQTVTQGAWGGLPTLAGLAAGGGGRVRTTLEVRTQQTAARVLGDQWVVLQSSGIDSAGIVVVDVATGELRAAVSRSTAAPGVDLTRAARSTGSVLKPFIYAAGFEMGVLTPETEVVDSPKAWAGYVPANFDRGYRGNMAAGEALAESRNIPAMTVLAKVGVNCGVGMLNEVGIVTPGQSGREYGLSLAIGGAEASLLEVAAGYATLARGGRRLPVRVVTGTAAEGVRVLREEICWETLACLSGRARTEGVPGGMDAAALGAAWKTGTSNGLRDAWCAAATRRWVVVVWLGNAAGKGRAALVGQEAAAPVALKLLGIIDRGGEGWPVVPMGEGMRALSVNTRLCVVSPVGGTEILMGGAGEADGGGAVALKAAGGTGGKRWWFANGELVSVSEGSGGGGGGGATAWWRPAAGSYELRVVDEAGAGATVRVSVR